MTYESARDFINMITRELKYEKLIIDLLSLKKKGKANPKKLNTLCFNTRILSCIFVLKWIAF